MRYETYVVIKFRFRNDAGVIISFEMVHIAMTFRLNDNEFARTSLEKYA